MTLRHSSGILSECARVCECVRLARIFLERQPQIPTISNAKMKMTAFRQSPAVLIVVISIVSESVGRHSTSA